VFSGLQKNSGPKKISDDDLCRLYTNLASFQQKTAEEFKKLLKISFFLYRNALV
jgi:hypothetical protein